MAIDFPSSPTDGQIFISDGARFVYRNPPGAWQSIGPSSALQIVDSGSNYQIWGDMLMQWGNSPAQGIGVDVNIVFPIAYQTTPTVTASLEWFDRILSIFGVGVFGFNARIRSNNSVNSQGEFNWIAIGEAPNDRKLPKII